MTVINDIIANYNYLITIFLMVSGLYIVVAKSNMIKTLLGLATRVMRITTKGTCCGRWGEPMTRSRHLKRAAG